MVHFLILANKFSIMKSPKPYSVGRVVMYVPTDGDKQSIRGNASTSPLPAIIANAWEENPYYQEQGQVNLKVFTDGSNDYWATSIPYDESKTPGTWHWPEVK
jgi:hypothetical protein